MRCAALPLALAALVLSAPDAAADGLPLVDHGVRPDSVDLPHGPQRLLAVPVDKDATVAMKMGRADQVRQTALLPGTWAIPAVAYDGTPGGVAADGSLFTLIRPRVDFPRKTTEFTLLKRGLGVHRRIRLDGDFSFDAISPDGDALFLVEYPNRRDPAVYRVRVYDVAAGRLLPEPLLDTGTAAIVMRGLPVTRAAGPGGAVEYTLYDGFGDPFVHALDTVQRSALCIPLPGRPQRRQIGEMRFDRAPDGLALTVPGRGTYALIDTESNTARPMPLMWAPITAALTDIMRLRV